MEPFLTTQFFLNLNSVTNYITLFFVSHKTNHKYGIKSLILSPIQKILLMDTKYQMLWAKKSTKIGLRPQEFHSLAKKTDKSVRNHRTMWQGP